MVFRLGVQQQLAGDCHLCHCQEAAVTSVGAPGRIREPRKLPLRGGMLAKICSKRTGDSPQRMHPSPRLPRRV